MNKLLTGVIAVASVGLSMQANALNILLTNDDGCRAPGIDAMYRALTAAGHKVTLVGPLNDSSGISAASVVVPGQALAVTELAPGKFCVGPPQGYAAPAGKTSAIGTPVDAVNVGLDVVLKDSPPDLVVSGSNFGENVGPLTQMSGTLNAAVRAMFKGIPAVAVSTAIDMDLIIRDQQAGYRKTLGAMDDTAQFAVKVIEQASLAGAEAKQACAKNKHGCDLNVLGLPGVNGLNLNYPPLKPEEVKGVSFAPIGNWDRVNFTSQRGTDGVVHVNLAPPSTPTATQQKADAYQLWQGHAVITVIDGNMTAPEAEQDLARKMLRGIKP
ncbi:5'/3'-nucleotidase SurE [Pseudomonas sp. SWRI74]|jgi:5'-nucleotidase|uniref:5'/3'-nucleotidase SurE n=1 Tax=Pseudomonas azerbaijanoccidentalis TaxID=2842347 RepID=A0ABS6QQ44_9PSED|nr:5'/3'-nucleotidase SurE [Pseudomonas azerbaijanoccidentalis]MBV4521062.1 5'/3'-nucleotidase SurE [Pseudomonas azerbaijanoccidentalis]